MKMRGRRRSLGCLRMEVSRGRRVWGSYGSLLGKSAFTRVDLLAVLVGVAMLGMLCVSGLAGTRNRGDLALCLSHFRELTRAWQLFAEDNSGALAGNLDGGSLPDSMNRTWVAGWLDNSQYTKDNTNILNLQNAQLGRYVPSVSVFACPQDPSLSHGRKGVPRVRSVSMNSYMGQRSGPYTSGYRQFRTMASIVGPNPSRAFVFIEEHEGSINDGMFAVDMAGYDPEVPGSLVILDVPSDRHEGAGPLSFVDGHVEDWRWEDDRTRRSHRPGLLLPLGQPSPGNRDVQRLQAAASSRLNRIPAQVLP